MTGLAFITTPFMLAACHPTRGARFSNTHVHMAPPPPRACTKTRAASSAKTLLYTHTLCPYAHRVELAFREKQIVHQLKHVDLSNKDAQFLADNPRGLVPAVMLEDGTCLVESVDIVKWLATEFSESGTNLTVPESIADADARVERAAYRAVSVIGGDKGAWSVGTFRRGGADAAVQAAAPALDDIRDLLAYEPGPYIGGESPCVYDLILYPFWTRAALALHEIHGAKSWKSKWSSVAAWLDAMDERPSAMATATNSQRLVAAWRRTGRLDFFDYETASRESL